MSGSWIGLRPACSASIRLSSMSNAITSCLRPKRTPIDNPTYDVPTTQIRSPEVLFIRSSECRPRRAPSCACGGAHDGSRSDPR